MEKVLAIKATELELLLESSRRDVHRAELLMSDYVNRENSYSDDVFKILCELSSANSLLVTTFESVKRLDNLVKEKYYKIEPLTYEAIRSSIALVKYLKEELAIYHLYIEEQ